MKEEIVEKMEEIVEKNLNKMNNGTLSNEEESNSIRSETNTFIEYLIKINEDELEAKDKEERRKLEHERNEGNIILEMKRMDIPWKKIGFEIGKTCLTTLLPIGASILIYDKVLKFEETGRATSFASRQLRMPNIFK